MYRSTCARCDSQSRPIHDISCPCNLIMLVSCPSSSIKSYYRLVQILQFSINTSFFNSCIFPESVKGVVRVRPAKENTAFFGDGMIPGISFHFAAFYRVCRLSLVMRNFVLWESGLRVLSLRSSATILSMSLYLDTWVYICMYRYIIIGMMQYRTRYVRMFVPL